MIRSLKEEIKELSNKKKLIEQDLNVSIDTIKRVENSIEFMNDSTKKIQKWFKIISCKNTKFKKLKNADNFEKYVKKIQTSSKIKGIKPANLEYLKSNLHLIEYPPITAIKISSLPIAPESQCLQIYSPFTCLPEAPASPWSCWNESIAVLSSCSLLLPLQLRTLRLVLGSPFRSALTQDHVFQAGFSTWNKQPNRALQTAIKEGATRRQLFEDSDGGDHTGFGDGGSDEDRIELERSDSEQSQESEESDESDESDEQEMILISKLAPLVPETLTHLVIQSKSDVDLENNSDLAEFLNLMQAKNIQSLEFIGFSNSSVLEKALMNLNHFDNLKYLTFRMCNPIPMRAKLDLLLADSNKLGRSHKNNLYKSNSLKKNSNKIERLTFHGWGIKDRDMSKVKIWVEHLAPNCKILNLTYNNLSSQVLPEEVDPTIQYPQVGLVLKKQKEADAKMPYSLKIISEISMRLYQIVLYNNTSLLEFLRQQKRNAGEDVVVPKHSRLWEKLKF